MLYFALFSVGAIVGCVIITLVMGPTWRKAEQIKDAAESLKADYEQRVVVLAEQESAARARDAELAERASDVTGREEAIQKRVIRFDELQTENRILKRDLQNIDVHLNKSLLDGVVLKEKQTLLDQRSTELAMRYLNETVKNVSANINDRNYPLCKSRLTDAITRVRDIGFVVTAEEESKFLVDLQRRYELALKAAFEREEQARIKAEMRDTERARREIEREKERIERQRLDEERRKREIEQALAEAMTQARGAHSAEVERLSAQLAQAQATLDASEHMYRTVSLAELTKQGYIYVISNVGAFGEGVFKVGMTRRLDPLDRVSELGDASVPFPFDVHMVIKCDDAPALEYDLHHRLHKCRLNKVNLRKEFFRTDLAQIVALVQDRCGTIEYTADAEALEYNQSLTMSAEDSAFIEDVFDKVQASSVAPTADET